MALLCLKASALRTSCQCSVNKHGVNGCGLLWLGAWGLEVGWVSELSRNPTSMSGVLYYSACISVQLTEMELFRFPLKVFRASRMYKGCVCMCKARGGMVS